MIISTKDLSSVKVEEQGEDALIIPLLIAHNDRLVAFSKSFFREAIESQCHAN